MSRPVYVRNLTKSEQAELSRLIRGNQDSRVVHRAQMIRLSARGKKTTENRLREHLGHKTGTLLNPCYLSQLMARESIVYRRPKHVMAHLRNPKDYNEKKAVLEFLKNAQSKGNIASSCSTPTNVKFTCTRR